MIEKIIKAVAEKFQITPDDITGRRRDLYVTKARRIAIYLAIHETHYVYSTVGYNFGNRDAVTVINACKWVVKNMAKCPEINEIRARLN